MLPERSFTRKCYYLIYLFMAGLFLGIVTVNVGHDMWITEEGLLNYGMLEQLKSSTPEGSRLLSYIIKHRMAMVCVIGALSTTMIGVPAVCFCIAYLGLTTGCLLSVAVIRYGIQGLMLAASGFFPQGIILVPGYLMLFCWGIELNRFLYGQGLYYGMSRVLRGKIWAKKGLQLMGIIIVVIIGCVLESYVNPKILNFILKIY